MSQNSGMSQMQGVAKKIWNHVLYWLGSGVLILAVFHFVAPMFDEKTVYQYNLEIKGGAKKAEDHKAEGRDAGERDAKCFTDPRRYAVERPIVYARESEIRGYYKLLCKPSDKEYDLQITVGDECLKDVTMDSESGVTKTVTMPEDGHMRKVRVETRTSGEFSCKIHLIIFVREMSLLSQLGSGFISGK